LNHLSRENLRSLGLYFRLGEYRTGVNHERQRAIEFEERGRLARAALCWSVVFRSHIALGEFVLAREARQRSAALATRLPNPSFASAHLIAGEDEWRMALDQDWGVPMEHFGTGVGQGTLRTWIRVGLDSAIARTLARVGWADHAMQRLAAVLATNEN